MQCASHDLPMFSIRSTNTQLHVDFSQVTEHHLQQALSGKNMQRNL